MLTRGHVRLRVITSLCITLLFFVARIVYCHVNSLSFANTSREIENSALGFQAIFAINAPWRTDRRDSLTLAAAFTDITIEWIDGVNVSSLDERAYPQGNHRTMPKGNLGSWRAHMNVIRTIVERNLTTALILEDDADWDPRVRSQLASFSLAARGLPDMITRGGVYATEDGTRTSAEPDVEETLRLLTSPLPSQSSSIGSPYGEDWDVLWLGHCGTSLPPIQNTSIPSPDRFLLSSDPTSSTSSRTYHRTSSTLCTLAYVVTQHGARKILYEHGIRNLDKGYDFALSEWCDGETKHMGKRPLCLTSSPSVFGHYWPEGGGKSDIAGLGKEGPSRYGPLEKSVRGGFEELVEPGF